MTAREAVRAGRRALAAHPVVTAAAVLATATGALGAAAAAARARAVVHADLSTETLGRAALLHFAGPALAALLAVFARACALAAYGGGRPITDGARRTPGFVSVAAVELTVQGMLLFGAGMVLLRRLHDAPPGQAALLATLVLGPALGLAAFFFVSARVAIALVSRGLLPAPALVRGLDVAWRRFPSLVRLGLALVAAAWPLLLAGLVAGLAGPLAAPLRVGFFAVAWLWGYATLQAWVGRDARLVFG